MKLKSAFLSLAAAIAIAVSGHQMLEGNLNFSKSGSKVEAELIFERTKTDEILELLVEAQKKLEGGKISTTETTKAKKLAEKMVREVKKTRNKKRIKKAEELLTIVIAANDNMLILLSEQMRDNIKDHKK